MIFLVCYDLTKKKPEFDYEVLWNELKRLDAHRVQESVWIVELSGTVKQAFDRFKRFVHGDDRLWVSSVRSNEYWYTQAYPGTNAWLGRHKAVA